jgi:hypothetical protein
MTQPSDPICWCWCCWISELEAHSHVCVCVCVLSTQRTRLFWGHSHAHRALSGYPCVATGIMCLCVCCLGVFISPVQTHTHTQRLPATHRPGARCCWEFVCFVVDEGRGERHDCGVFWVVYNTTQANHHHHTHPPPPPHITHQSGSQQQRAAAIAATSLFACSLKMVCF